MKFMIRLEIGKNEEEQRLDRFLRKYFRKASLGRIYKMIRKDVRVNGKRVAIETFLTEGDQVDIFMSDEEAESYRETKKTVRALRQFAIAYEDRQMLVVSKPYGLLTHGDANEKKNTLANQVLGYLTEKGDYQPRIEKTFVPSPVNRLDRNTTGLVIFGKDSETLKRLNQMIRDRDSIEKYYMTIVSGDLREPMVLRDTMVKDGKTNTVTIQDEPDSDGKWMESRVKPIRHSPNVPKNPVGKTEKIPAYTLVEVQLITGRSHQIRAQLAAAGFPIIGDTKYGNPQSNRLMKSKFGLTTQLLHAYKLVIDGNVVEAPIPDEFQRITGVLIDGNESR
jgi:23S rRNA pseudouridine955/2504/2580 synthase